MTDIPEWAKELARNISNHYEMTDMTAEEAILGAVLHTWDNARAEIFAECEEIADRYLKDSLTPTRNPSFVVLDILEAIRLQSKANQ